MRADYPNTLVKEHFVPIRYKRVAILAVLFIVLNWITVVQAAETVVITIPTFPVTVNDETLDCRSDRYPFILYEGITYFPLTFDHCSYLGVSTAWTEQDGLYVGCGSYLSGKLPDYGQADNSGAYYTANIVSFPVFINGARINNEQEEYPLLMFRDITYFPITWRFAVDEFSWQLAWNNGLEINRINQGAYSINSVTSAGAELARYKAIYASEVAEDGTHTVNFVRNEAYYAYLDFSDDSVTSLDNLSQEMTYVDRSFGGEVSIEIQGDFLVYEGEPIADIADLVALDAQSGNGIAKGYPPYAHASLYNFDGGYLLQVSVFYNNGIPAPYSPSQNYHFVSFAGGDLIQLKFDSGITMVRAVSDGIYVATNFYQLYSQSARYSNCLLWFISWQGETLKINDCFADYGYVELLGTVGDIAYLKCLWDTPWQPPRGADREPNVSLINDGYFMMTRDYNLSKIYPYIESHGEMLTDAGELYALPIWRNGILNLSKGTFIDLSEIPAKVVEEP